MSGIPRYGLRATDPLLMLNIKVSEGDTVKLDPDHFVLKHGVQKLTLRE